MYVLSTTAYKYCRQFRNYKTINNFDLNCIKKMENFYTGWRKKQIFLKTILKMKG
jgi:hypothetical protein